MLKQGVVQETLAELNTGSALPPLHNLPHWSRVNNFDKARYPKPFLKDRLQPLPNPSEMEGIAAVITSPPVLAVDMDVLEDTQLEVTRNSNQVQRVVHLERSIQFLQQQHYEVLTNLHEEIDKLKRANKELQFQIVMIQKGPSNPGSAGSQRSASKSHMQSASRGTKNHVGSSNKPSMSRVPHPPSAHKHGATDTSGGLSEQPSYGSEEKVEDLKILFLEEEIKELKKALKEERNTNHYLQDMLDTTQKQAAVENSSPQVSAPVVDHKSHSAKTTASSQPVIGSQPTTSAPNLDKPSPPASKPLRTPPRSAALAQQPLPFNATLNPLRIQTAHHGTRIPNTQECEMIIKHMQRLNDSQAHELSQLKTDLRDVLYSHKWTPDAYLLAKAYVAEDDAREAEQGHLPRLAMKHSTRKLPDVAYLQKDTVSLPALKHTLGNKAIERKKRAQILQKSRLGPNKEVAN